MSLLAPSTRIGTRLLESMSELSVTNGLIFAPIYVTRTLRELYEPQLDTVHDGVWVEMIQEQHKV